MEHTIILIVGAAAGVIIFAAAAMNPIFAIYMLPFCFSLSPEIAIAKTAAREVTVRVEDFLLGILLIRMIFEYIMGKKRASLNKSVIYLPLLLYVSSMVLSTIFGILLGYVRPLSGFFFTLKLTQYYLFFIVFYYYIRNEKDVQRIFTFALITLSVIILIAMAQPFTRPTMPFEGESGEPNTLGGYLVLYLGLLGSLIVYQPKARNKNIYLILLALTFIVLLRSQSRAAWVGALSLFLTFTFMIKGFEKKFVALAVVIIGIMLIPLLPSKYKERATFWKPEEGYKETVEFWGIKFEPSAGDRVARYLAGLQAFTEKPIIGYGVTGGGVVLDSQYLRVLLETGLVGFIIFYYGVFIILKYSYNVYKSTPNPFRKSLAFGIFVITIAMQAENIATATYIIVRIMEPYWMLVALLISYNKFSPEDLVSAEGLRYEGAKPEVKTIAPGEKGYTYPFLVDRKTPTLKRTGRR
jgi:O-antigen ligase